MIPLEEPPVLDTSRCTTCGDCQCVCPTRCLEIRGGQLWMPRPADCIACALCVWVCPADALALADPPPLPPWRALLPSPHRPDPALESSPSGRRTPL